MLAESSALPGDHRFGLDEHERLAPTAHTLASQTQRSRSDGLRRGRRGVRCRTASWWRNVRISICMETRDFAVAVMAASNAEKKGFMALGQ